MRPEEFVCAAINNRGAMEAVYIGHVEISLAMAQKLQTKHGVTPDEIRAACENRVVAAWNYHPNHGRRLLVVGRSDRRRGYGRVLKIILQPVDERDGYWRLRTAIAPKER